MLTQSFQKVLQAQPLFACTEGMMQIQDGGNEIDGMPSALLSEAKEVCKVMALQDNAASRHPFNAAQCSDLHNNSLEMLPRPLLQHKAHPLPPLAQPMKHGQTSDNHKVLREAGNCAALAKSRPRMAVLPIANEPHTASERRGAREQWPPSKVERYNLPT